jgi:2-octaprenyl-6-methoxyphenol hydroxylase
MTTTDKKTDMYDVAVIGGGLAGLSMGIALGRAGLKVAVLDRENPADAITAAYDGRSIAVAYASWQLFQAIDAWQYMEAEAQPMNDIMITDGSAPVFLKFEHDAVGSDPFGYMVEMRHLRAGLAKAVATCPTVSLMAPMNVDRVDIEPGHASVVLQGGKTIQARLAIAADGRQSPLRQAAGITTTNAGYDQTGIVTTIEHELDHKGVAYEHFRPSGPFAILPLKGKRSSLVWAEKPVVAEAILGLDDDAFNQEIVKRMGNVLGEVRAVGPRFSYPLTLQLANAFYAERLALIGDAAHGIHPIAGQGINLGWRDVAALAELIVDAQRLGMDIGSSEVLAKYERWRKSDTLIMAAATDVLDRLFSNDIGPLRLARDIGLALVNRVGPAKRFFMNQARGAGGNQPKLLKGEAL